MSTEKNSEEEKKKIDDLSKLKNLFLQGWNGFVSEIKDGFVNVQQAMEETSNRNQESMKKNRENVEFFFHDIKQSCEDDFNQLTEDIQNSQLKNRENWEKNKEKITSFFKTSQQQWNDQLITWNEEIKQKQSETAEEWEARRIKLTDDFNNWKVKSKRNWEKGLKTFRREMIKGSYMFLVFMTPILVVLIIVVWLITWAMNGFN
ncbi:MAG: hypothetical protein ACTSP9_04155 [Promethearchaeota archaeon]